MEYLARRMYFFVTTVHSYVYAGRFHACMRNCLCKCTKGAPFYKHRILQMRQIAAKHAENFANGACELLRTVNGAAEKT